MSEEPRRSQNRLVVDLRRGSDGSRSLSPIGGIGENEGIELKDIKDFRNRKGTPRPPKEAFDIQEETDVDDVNSDREDSIYRADDSNLRTPRQITVISLPGNESDPGDTGTKGHGPRTIKPSSGGSGTSGRSWSPASRRAKEHEGATSGRSRKSDFSSTLLDLSLSENSTSPGISRMASGASGSVEDDDLDYFCVDHMKLCSNKSIRDEHSTCENLVPAFEWAEAQRMENDRRQIDSRLKRFDTFAGIMIDDRKDYKTKLELSKEDATEDFLDMMEDLIAHLLVKQREFIAGFDEAHDKHLKSINEQIRRCKKVQTETSASLKQLSELVPGSEEHQKLKRKLYDKCPVYEEILRRDFRSAVRQDYQFVPDPGTEALFMDLQRLGGIKLRPVASKLPGFLSESSETDYLKRTVKEVCRNEGRSASDENSCCFSGCCFLSGGQMVLADWNNTCLKMFNAKGVLIHKLPLPNNPWDVKKVDDSKLVVSIPGEQKLCIVGYTKTALNLITSIDTDCECWGVAPVKNTFVVISDPWGKDPCLKVFSDTGGYLAFYQKDSRGKMLFRYPEHIATDHNQTTLYISDSRSNMVIALTLGGRTLFRYVHSRLEYPAGVATDNQGNVYVCGKDSQNVHQIDKDGEFVRMIFDRIDVECPRAICFEPNGDNFIVTDVVAHACDDFITAKLG